MKVFYSEKMVADQGEQSYGGIQSPSAKKPKQIAEALKSLDNIQFIEPNPLSIDDFKLSHDPDYVDGVMSLQLENGFGSKSQSVVDSLPYTNGAMYDAAKAATLGGPTCALVSGFHHAGYNGWKNLGWFCTFNGLTIAAYKMLKEGYSKIAIIDCDMHWGNGTDNILNHEPSFHSNSIHEPILHISFGRYLHQPQQAERYLQWLSPKEKVYEALYLHKSNVILYQAGADVHVNDPYGGVLTTEQIYERDIRMFSIAKELNIPIAWNLAGGYQIEADGSIDKVIEIHLNTFKACKQVYGG